jgi:hypothetical protein
MGLKSSMAALLSITIASYNAIKRLALIYFPYAQQDHKLNTIGITVYRLHGSDFTEKKAGTYSTCFFSADFFIQLFF